MDRIIIGNAAGTCKSVADVRRFAQVRDADYVTVGSVTAAELLGNPDPREYVGPYEDFVNSIGLKNDGAERYEKHLEQMLLILRAVGKKLRVSVAGFSPEEYVVLARLAVRFADVIELNFGCPNAWKDGKQKRIVSFDLTLMANILDLTTKALEETGGPMPQIAVKLSPYSDPSMIPDVAALIRERPVVSSLVLCNTWPNALPLRPDGTKAISGKGYGGWSGRPYKPIVLGQIAQFRECLPEEFPITGVGGIWQGLDLRDYENVGANDFQVGSEAYRFGEMVIQRIIGERVAME